MDHAPLKKTQDVEKLTDELVYVVPPKPISLSKTNLFIFGIIDIFGINGVKPT